MLKFDNTSAVLPRFFGNYAQLRDTAGPHIFQSAKTKLLPFAARSSHRVQQDRCCPNPTQCCLYPGLKGQVLRKLELGPLLPLFVTSIYIKRKSN